MSHIVPAIGAAAVTAAGSVWYIPALIDLRAGEDRPQSTRTAAAACVVWWASAAFAAVLLFLTTAWAPPLAVLAAGAVAGTALRTAAGLHRRAEVVEERRIWSQLGAGARSAERAHRPHALLTLMLLGFTLWSMTAGSLLMRVG